MNKTLRSFAAILALALISSFSAYATSVPAITNVTSVMAVKQVVWQASGNGYNRCVSFTDGGLVPYSISPGYVSVKYWLAPSRFETHNGLLAPDRHYKWRISGGVLYLRWYGTSIESAYPLHPYGITPNNAYVIQIKRKDVAVTVDGLPGTFVLGSKIPLIPIIGGSGSFAFSGPSDMTGNPETDTGLWFRPITLKSVTP